MKTQAVSGSGDTAALPADLKVKNRSAVLKAFMQGGEYTINDIASLTGISRQTVKKAIQFFCEKNLVMSTGKGESTDTGGKKPELFTFSYNKYILCITMWPGDLNVSLLDMRAKLIDKIENVMELPRAAEDAFSLIGGYIQGLLQRNHVSKEELFGAGISTAGTINYKTNRLKYSSLSPGWGVNIPVADYLKNFIGNDTVIFVENAGKMTGRSLLMNEQILKERVLVIFSTWGLSACFIDKGHIMSGKDSLIGEIGHMVIDPDDDERCGCGSYGCFERLTSEKRIRRIIERNPDGYSASLLRDTTVDQITLDVIFAASEKRDPFAREIVDYLARLFSLLLRNITLAFDPSLVVFQGNYAYADSFFDAKLKEYISEFKYYPRGGSFAVKYDKRSLLDLDVLGCSKSIMNIFLESPANYQD